MKVSQSGMIISCAGYLLSQELIAQLQFRYTQHVSSRCFASAFQLIYIVARFLKLFLINTCNWYKDNYIANIIEVYLLLLQ